MNGQATSRETKIPTESDHHVGPLLKALRTKLILFSMAANDDRLGHPLKPLPVRIHTMSQNTVFGKVTSVKHGPTQMPQLSMRT